MAQKKIYYPPPGFHFKVEIMDESNKALEEVAFQEVTGITAEIRTEQIIEGGENETVYKVPQSVQYPNLVLKRGLVAPSSKLADWCKTTIQSGLFEIKPRVIVVSLLTREQSAPVMSWKFEQAYPIKYDISGFNAERNEIVIETIELVYRKFEKM